MNKVNIKNSQPEKTILVSVISSNQTAFVGKCGYGPQHSLYLIGYDRIMLANEPNKTWSGGDCEVIIDRYCDVEIKEI